MIHASILIFKKKSKLIFDEVQIRQSNWVRPDGAKMLPSRLQKW